MRLGLYVRVELDVLLHDKAWAGADAETVTGIPSVQDCSG